MRTNVVAALVFAACAAATLLISTATPLLALGYAGVVFAAALYAVNSSRDWKLRPDNLWHWMPLVGISLWGFLQLAASVTEDRWETFLAAMRFSSYTSTVLVVRLAVNTGEERDYLLVWLSWFASVLAIVSVLAYYTSPSKILWVFPSPYPDVWGPFLSRNNFAQFLELALPVSLWLGIRRRFEPVYIIHAAIAFGAGMASASRAGAILLTLEVVAIWLLAAKHARTMLFGFAGVATIAAAVMGAGTLFTRLQAPDPFLHRREFYESTVAMIRARPRSGFGLGTFAEVYPEFAEFDTGLRVDHAHNDWLEWSAEGGLIFVALCAAWTFPLCYRAVRSIWGLGVAAVFLHALVDYPFARPGVAAWLFLLAGLLSGVNQKECSHET